MAELIVLVIASIATFIGAYYGVLIGGGSLLVTPLLLSLGIPPIITLGVRRFSILGGSIASFIQFNKKKKVDYKLGLSLVIFAIIGGVLGFLFINSIDEFILKKIIGAIIILLLTFIIFENDKKVKKLRSALYNGRFLLGPIFTIISRFVSVIIGGAGILASYVLIIIYGKSILDTSGTTKITAIISGTVITGLFIFKGYIDYSLAIPLFIAHALGGWFGSKFYLKQGEEKVKYFFYVIVFVLAIKVLFF